MQSVSMSISSIKLIVMKTTFICALCTAVLFFASCNSGKTKNESNKSIVSDLAPLEKPDGTLAPPSEDQQQIPVTANGQPYTADSATWPPVPASRQAVSKPDWDKKIIKNGNLKVEVKDFKSFSEKVHQTVKQFGGYIAQEEQSLTNEKAENVITIKVPVPQFEDMLNQLPGTDNKVLERKITSEDVTGEVVDTRSRLEAKKQVRQKYLEFLKESRNTEEVLKVQNEINSIQEEIESAASRIGYLSNQAAYSTIHLTYFQPAAGYQPADENPGLGTRTANAFRSGASWFAELFIALLSIWPLLLAVSVVFVIWKRMRAGKVAVQKM